MAPDRNEARHVPQLYLHCLGGHQLTSAGQGTARYLAAGLFAVSRMFQSHILLC